MALKTEIIYFKNEDLFLQKVDAVQSSGMLNLKISNKDFGVRFRINVGKVSNNQVIEYCTHLIAFLAKDDERTCARLILVTR